MAFINHNIMKHKKDKKKVDLLITDLILDLIDENTPIYKIHKLSNEYITQFSKLKKKKKCAQRNTT